MEKDEFRTVFFHVFYHFCCKEYISNYRKLATKTVYITA